MGFEELVKCLESLMAESDNIQMVALVDQDGLVLHAIDRKKRGDTLLNRISSAMSSLFTDTMERTGKHVHRMDILTQEKEVVIGMDYGEGRVLCLLVNDIGSHAFAAYLAQLYKPKLQKIIHEF